MTTFQFRLRLKFHLSHFPDGHRWGHPRHRQSHRKTNALNRLWICHLHVCGERKIRAYHKLLLFLRHIALQSKLSVFFRHWCVRCQSESFDSAIGQLAGLFWPLYQEPRGQKITQQKNFGILGPKLNGLSVRYFWIGTYLCTYLENTPGRSAWKIAVCFRFFLFFSHSLAPFLHGLWEKIKFFFFFAPPLILEIYEVNHQIM